MKVNVVLAVVVTYNRLPMLQQTIKYIQGQVYPCDILVVNNCSTDTTKEYLDNLNTDGVYHENMTDNLGGAGGFHYGIKWGVEHGYDYIWIMDDDCFPDKNALNELMIAKDRLKEAFGWLSSIALWTDGLECVMNRPKLRKDFFTHIHHLKDGIVKAEQATFVSLLLSRDIVIKAGLPLKEFFIWGDDIEYTRRIAVRLKIPSFVVGKSIVTHAMENNVGSNIATDVIERIPRYRYAFRNECYLYRQEGFKGIVYYIGKCGWNVLKILLKAKQKRWLRIYTVLSAIVRGCVFSPLIEYPQNLNIKEKDI